MKGEIETQLAPGTCCQEPSCLRMIHKVELCSGCGKICEGCQWAKTPARRAGSTPKTRACKVVRMGRSTGL
jgi:hypothetical protein